MKPKIKIKQNLRNYFIRKVIIPKIAYFKGILEKEGLGSDVDDLKVTIKKEDYQKFRKKEFGELDKDILPSTNFRDTFNKLNK